MSTRATSLFILLGVSLATPLAAQTDDYQGSSETPRSSREANTHYPGFAVDQGSMDTNLFNQLDRNQDGTLSGEELDAYGEPAAGEENEDKLRLLDRYDANDNGMISQEEFDQGRE